jgi:Protein of unknown function (DUF3822)
LVLQTFFDIGSYKVVKDEEPVLLWEIGNNYSLLSLWTDDMKSCRHVQVNMFQELEVEESIQQIITPYREANLKFKKVVICSGFPEALLVPRKYFAQDSHLLNFVYDVEDHRSFYDFAGEWQLVNLYAVPARVMQIISDHFPFVSFRHVYTPTLKATNEVDASDQISIHIINKQFRVLVKKDNFLKLMQTFTFSVPMDVVYYLIKICNEFGMSQEETHLTISGFIDHESSLYKELYQYFINIDFANHDEVGMPEHHYPQHFFTSLYNLASCVS